MIILELLMREDAFALAQDLASGLGLEGEGSQGLWQRCHPGGPLCITIFSDPEGLRVVLEARGEDPWKMLGALAAFLPSGLDDPRAPAKFRRERDEFFQANRDYLGACLELGDVCYYLAKLVHMECVTAGEAHRLVEDLAVRLGLSFEDALAIALIKYTLRARPGNPKNDEEERMLLSQILSLRGKQLRPPGPNELNRVE